MIIITHVLLISCIPNLWLFIISMSSVSNYLQQLTLRDQRERESRGFTEIIIVRIGMCSWATSTRN